jgi:hypothetical protein
MPQTMSRCEASETTKIVVKILHLAGLNVVVSEADLEPQNPGKSRRFVRTSWWAMQGSNLLPLPCENTAPPSVL